MPKIHLCFLWHMHQPYYKNLVTGEYRLPWVRLHALKDYFGMVKILDEFPDIHQTFNLVPSLVLQLEDYAAGVAKDPFLDAAVKPAEELSAAECEFILTYFFQANRERVIRRFPRYSELFDILQRNDGNPQRAAAHFDAAAIRDLQVLSQLAWFDEYDLAGDPAISALRIKGRDFTIADQQTVAATETACLKRVIGAYRTAAERGQIELSASAYYHPILPLLCDSNIAHTAHPYVPLPQQFAYPDDALEQMVRSRGFFASRFGVQPAGLWPSEGAVSEQVLELAAQAGFAWTASDNEILARSLQEPAAGDATYRPYVWSDDDTSIQVLFRDRRLSDLVALAYASMSPDDAARHFMAELKRSCANVLSSGRDALVPIILDGENAWENYVQNGRPFLRALYERISGDPAIESLTISEALQKSTPQELPRLYPGSWIDANFDIWIGDKEDNLAWEYLLSARRAYDEAIAAGNVSASAKTAAFEELLIAEGSDWCWWYGPENSSANQGDFDQLFRDHLANFYRLLNLEPPSELSVPIAQTAFKPQHEPPSGLIQPVVDGVLSSAREWENAGQYSADPRMKTLHGQRGLLLGLRYGSDGQNLYFRVDLTEPVHPESGLEFVLKMRTNAAHYEIRSTAADSEAQTELPPGAVQVAAADMYEARVSMSALRIRLGDPVHLRFELLRDGLPVAALPHDGELSMHSGNLAAYAY